MTLFRSELLPFHPPRHRPRIGEGLARYGRVSAARRAHPQHQQAPHAPTAGSARFDEGMHLHDPRTSPPIAQAA